MRIRNVSFLDNFLSFFCFFKKQKSFLFGLDNTWSLQFGTQRDDVSGRLLYGAAFSRAVQNFQFWKDDFFDERVGFRRQHFAGRVAFVDLDPWSVHQKCVVQNQKVVVHHTQGVTLKRKTIHYLIIIT